MPTIARKGCNEVGNLKSRDHGANSLPNEVDKKAGTIYKRGARSTRVFLWRREKNIWKK